MNMPSPDRNGRLHAVRRVGLIGQVTEELRAKITAGEWTVGAKIPTEGELAEMTGTGRNTVREAVQALVYDGLLERRQGSGTYVTATSSLGSALAKHIGPAQRRDILELRQALDVTASSLAARRRDSADVELLTAAAERRRTAWRTGAVNEQVAADLALHRAIVVAAHNPLYLEVYDSLVDTMREEIESNIVHGENDHNEEHDELVLAVVAGDDEKAGRIAHSLLTQLLASL
ncbi:FadR/GntR family transcriptional regulator [Compostimonas suwonensis]|uniref:DNA-binding FadR family transcriptional regulator n=1 Tax=Compostimonas suwonensis TaxID=1048394 RepID=A0A2M9C4W7_9MICO|nr:GntR family transcriptional regulator [Compostimonas suwonensis]PJJ65552.1 DNA-binding FadR family transcriptional regulator [Compostimonas suwonensis]